MSQFGRAAYILFARAGSLVGNFAPVVLPFANEVLTCAVQTDLVGNPFSFAVGIFVIGLVLGYILGVLSGFCCSYGRRRYGAVRRAHEWSRAADTVQSRRHLAPPLAVDERFSSGDDSDNRRGFVRGRVEGVVYPEEIACPPLAGVLWCDSRGRPHRLVSGARVYQELNVHDFRAQPTPMQYLEMVEVAAKEEARLALGQGLLEEQRRHLRSRPRALIMMMTRSWTTASVCCLEYILGAEEPEPGQPKRRLMPGCFRSSAA